MNAQPAVRCLAIEASATGFAYAAGLCLAGTGLVASFRPDELSSPYWSGVPGLRTDTAGILAFVVAAACFSTSEFLRLLRRRDARQISIGVSPEGSLALFAVSISETAALLATGLVIYVSVNAVTHPATLGAQATHLAAWPTEGTARVAALIVCACAVAALRFLAAIRMGHGASHAADANSRSAPLFSDRRTSASRSGLSDG